VSKPSTNKKNVEKQKNVSKNQQQPRKRGKNAQTDKRKDRSMTLYDRPRTDAGEGVRQNIMVIAPLSEDAVQACPLALVSMAYARGWYLNVNNGSMYWAYFAFMKDLIAILSNNTSPVSGRLRYLNGILASLIPKEVPFKTSALEYAWDSVNAVAINPKIIVRGYVYYLFERDNGLNSGGWRIQVPPPTPPQDTDTYPVLAAMYTLLSNDKRPSCVYAPNIAFSDEYKKDVSAFAAVSIYYGNGNSGDSSGAATSVENEVPFKSPILACFSPYQTIAGRVARNFNLAGGDSCAALGYGLLPEFDYSFYGTKYPVSFKFLDLDEVVVFVELWFMALVSSAIDNLPAISSGSVASSVYAALAPFTCTPQQFRIMVRQCVMSMFNNAQSLFQFIRYSDGTGSFEPLRVGSNTYGVNLQSNMIVPLLLQENLRALLPQVFDIKTKYFNPKNKQLIVPVWGVYRGASPNNPEGPLWIKESFAPSPMFTGGPNDDPNIIDGTDTNSICCDLNASSYVSDLIVEWNARINILTQFSTPTGFVGGSGYGHLLTVTRYATYIDQKSYDLKNVSEMHRQMLPRQCIKRTKLTRTISKKDFIEDVEVYIPGGGSLMTQYTSAFSSIGTITDSSKQILPYFIFPTVVLEEKDVPSQRQYRVYSVEGQVLDIDKPVVSAALGARYYQIQNAAGKCVVGTAGSKNDEIQNVIDYMSCAGKGGFIGDVLGMLAKGLPF